MAASSDARLAAYDPMLWQPSHSQQLPTRYSPHLGRARETLCARLRGAPAGDTLCQYFGRGKMLRAFLVFAAADAVGGDPEDVIMAAVAIELLHGASLFHDDIMDHAAERRGIVALHEKLGVGQALVVGDDLLLRAFTALAEARIRHSASTVLEAMQALNELARECCRGQFEELCSGRWISEEQYLAIVAGKTAAPFVAAGALGALLGGGNKKQVAQIRLYARELGIAFQIVDDLLDLIGEPGSLGKPVGNSLAEGRPTLPLIYLWQESSDAMRQKLLHLGENGCSREWLIGLLKEHRIIDRILQIRKRYLLAAISALTAFQRSSAIQALRSLALHAAGQATP